MGADLITYMLVGPNKLDEDPVKKEKAILHASRLIEAMTAWQTLHDEHEENNEEDELEVPLALVRTLKRYGIDPRTCDIRDYNDGVIDVNAENAVQELFELWNGGGRHFRDVCTRGYRKRQILVAGDMSWGDAPEGDGYRICVQSERLGLFRFYGIE